MVQTVAQWHSSLAESLTDLIVEIDRQGLDRQPQHIQAAHALMLDARDLIGGTMKPSEVPLHRDHRVGFDVRAEGFPGVAFTAEAHRLDPPPGTSFDERINKLADRVAALERWQMDVGNKGRISMRENPDGTADYLVAPPGHGRPDLKAVTDRDHARMIAALLHSRLEKETRAGFAQGEFIGFNVPFESMLAADAITLTVEDNEMTGGKRFTITKKDSRTVPTPPKDRGAVDAAE